MSNNNGTISPQPGATDLVSFKILSDNNPVSGEYRILSIEVSRHCNKIAYAKISLIDGDPAKQDFPISGKDDSLVPGHDFEIQLGYHGKPVTIFKGIIIRHTIRSNKNKASTLTIEAKDKCIRLTTTRKSKNFTDKTDAEIFSQILKEAGFGDKELEIEDTAVKHREMIQYNAADWDFIVTRAEMNSLLVFTDNNRLVIKKPDTGQAPVKELTYGKEIIEFDSELAGAEQIKEVKSQSWNYKDQAMENAEAETTAFKEAGNITGESLAEAFNAKEYTLVHPGSLKEGELQSWSDARLLKSRMAKIRGRIKLKGMADIGPGQVITLKGFGKRFNGNVYVTGVRQVYDKAVWETEIIFGLSESWFHERVNITEKAASGMVPGVSGLQIGVVLKLEGDPDNEDRIQIQLPALTSKEGLWARVAALDAGKDRGSFFRPEINDEVVVGFLADDPRHAVVLGMLHSSAKPAPFRAKDANNEKGFVTRSGLKFTLNDEQKKIVLQTPKGKSIEMDEEGDRIILQDEHNNKVQLTADGIVLESAKDISFKTAAGNVKLEGVNIEVKATGKFSANGNAAAELQSAGQTVVKGGIVNIN